MIFSSYGFLLIFFPITLIGYYILQQYCTDKLSKLWLIVASLIFYGLGNIQFVPILFLTAVFNYYLGTALRNHLDDKRNPCCS